MGNADLRDIAHIREIDQTSVSGEFVAVDASHWLYRYMTTTTRFTQTDSYTSVDGVELPNLIGVPRGIRKFFKYNVMPVFVFDGTAHQLKSDEIERRREARDTAAEKAKESTDEIETAKYKSRSQHLNAEIINTTQDVLDYLDVPYVTAPQAAEAQTARMSKDDKFDAAITDDYDSIVFGAPRTIRKFTTSEEVVEIMSLSKTLEDQDLTHDQLILATILCGTDYNTGVSGVGPKTSIRLVRENPSIEELRTELDDSLENAETIYELFSNPDVTDAWPEPKQSIPDTDGLKSYLIDKGIEVDEIETALDEIDENSSQAGLNSF